MTAISINLPWPPSVNGYWRHPTRGPLAGRHLISEQGRNYLHAVASECARTGLLNARIETRLCVEVMAYPPDRRKRDIDNLNKSLLDSLAHAGVYLDDSQIDRLVIERGEVCAPGRVVVKIREYSRLGALTTIRIECGI